jgi:hypothetical protein
MMSRAAFLVVRGKRLLDDRIGPRSRKDFVNFYFLPFELLTTLHIPWNLGDRSKRTLFGPVSQWPNTHPQPRPSRQFCVGLDFPCVVLYK